MLVQEIETVNWQDSLSLVDSKDPSAGKYATPLPQYGLVTLGDKKPNGNSFVRH